MKAREKMATEKRTSDITVALYEWNELTTRNIAEDEKEYFNSGFEFVWEGKTPEIDEEVLVYNPTTKQIITDTWVDYGEGIGFENTDEDVVFWMSYPQPPSGKMMKKREMPKIDDFVFALQVGKLVVDTAKAIIVDDNILGSNGKFVLDGHTFNITVSEVE